MLKELEPYDWEKKETESSRVGYLYFKKKSSRVRVDWR